MADVEKFHFRLVLLGSHQTGKTSILNRFLSKKFETKYRPTVEDLFTKDFDLGSIHIKVDFLDTSGSMQFPAMRRLSITTGSAFLLVYAVDDETSYEVLKMCIAEIQEIRPDYQEIPIVFAGNKCDIPREKRKVLKETVSNYVHYELPRLRAKVIECSCRDGINVENIFRAYLSLAKVSLSSALSVGAGASVNASAGSNKTLGQQGLVIPANEQTGVPAADDESDKHTKLLATSRRASSMKVVLGVRKSCDASIAHQPPASTRRSTLLGCVTQSDHPEEQRAHHDSPRSQDPKAKLRADKHRPDTPKRTGSDSSDRLLVRRPIEDATESTAAVADLETTIQSKLNVSQPAKPRSRSLIWHSARKSRSSQPTNECRVS